MPASSRKSWLASARRLPCATSSTAVTRSSWVDTATRSRVSLRSRIHPADSVFHFSTTGTWLLSGRLTALRRPLRYFRRAPAREASDRRVRTCPFPQIRYTVHRSGYGPCGCRYGHSSTVGPASTALVAQWIEHRSSEPRVGGSSPSECVSLLPDFPGRFASDCIEMTWGTRADSPVALRDEIRRSAGGGCQDICTASASREMSPTDHRSWPPVALYSCLWGTGEGKLYHTSEGPQPRQARWIPAPAALAASVVLSTSTVIPSIGFRSAAISRTTSKTSSNSAARHRRRIDDHVT